MAKSKSSEKSQEQPPPVPDGWTRCQAYLSKKHRYCRQTKNRDGLYCGNHQLELEGFKNSVEKSSGKGSTLRKRKRVPCPLDNSHTIFEDTIARHVKVCPKARLLREQEAEPYFRRNINSGGHGNGLEQVCKSPGGGRAGSLENLEKAQALALRVLTVHQALFMSESKPIKEISRHHIESALPLQDLSSSELEAGLAESIESYHIRCGGAKHLHQQASLLGHLRSSLPNQTEDEGNGVAKDFLILELGAGRGMLGLVATAALATSPARNVDLVMIEREGTRSKADTILRNHTSSLKDPCIKVEQIRHWRRIQCDLAHVHMPSVLSLHEESVFSLPNHGQKAKKAEKEKPFVIAVAKHLCGAGTDLALRALYLIRDQIKVCMFATCCHGVCNWRDYVGRDYLTAALLKDSSQDDGISDFSEDEFNLLRLWSAGTVVDLCATHNGSDKTNANDTESKPTAAEEDIKGKDSTDKDHQHAVLDQQFRHVGVSAVVDSLQLECGVQGLGRACQRLLDYGRKRYIEDVLFAGECVEEKPTLFYYVPQSATPQNAVLIASRR